MIVSTLGILGDLACSNTIAVLQNRKAILTAGGAAQNTARGAQVRHEIGSNTSDMPS